MKTRTVQSPEKPRYGGEHQAMKQSLKRESRQAASGSEYQGGDAENRAGSTPRDQLCMLGVWLQLKVSVGVVEGKTRSGL